MLVPATAIEAGDDGRRGHSDAGEWKVQAPGLRDAATAWHQALERSAILRAAAPVAALRGYFQWQKSAGQSDAFAKVPTKATNFVWLIIFFSAA